ncbi:MAG TPA: ferrochelatase [Patescibacteria group bacterium]|nr:ferrochelatase [Patescibacteria group bacterium]
MNDIGRSNFDHGARPAAGVVLVNLGTPDAPDTRSVRRYLAEFLSDPRVIELPRWQWWPILHGVILRIRPRRSAHAYQQVWTEAGSPLMVYSERLAAAVGDKLAGLAAGPIIVRSAMRYGRPALPEVLRELKAANVRRLFILPMYPQYSGTTTGSVFDALADELKRWRWIPDTAFVSDYHRQPGYLEALAESVRAHWSKGGRRHLLFSFHGIPKRYLHAGDPYHCHCHATARRVAELLGLGERDWTIAFQSRVGREPWLRPYTDETLAAMPGQGIRAVDVICPGFAVDCLETLEEIAVENRARFLAAGGAQFDYIPALNDRDEHAALVAQLVRERCTHWPEFSASAMQDEATARPLVVERFRKLADKA